MRTCALPCSTFCKNCHHQHTLNSKAAAAACHIQNLTLHSDRYLGTAREVSLQLPISLQLCVPLCTAMTMRISVCSCQPANVPLTVSMLAHLQVNRTQVHLSVEGASASAHIVPRERHPSPRGSPGRSWLSFLSLPLLCQWFNTGAIQRRDELQPTYQLDLCPHAVVRAITL